MRNSLKCPSTSRHPPLRKEKVTQPLQDQGTLKGNKIEAILIHTHLFCTGTSTSIFFFCFFCYVVEFKFKFCNKKYFEI